MVGCICCRLEGIAGVAGIMGGAVWPGYAAAKVWGRALWLA